MADITITIPTDQVPRVRSAIEALLILETNPEEEFIEPTAQEILDKAKEICIFALRRTVKKYEQRVVVTEAIATLSEIDIT